MELKYKDWHTITLEIYNEIEKILVSSDEEIDKNVQLLAVLTETDEDTIGDLPLSEFQQLIADSAFLSTPPAITPLTTTKFKFGENEYELQTNLQLMSAKQFIDYQNFSINYSKNRKYLIACFLLPKGKRKYADGYDVADVAADVEKNMSMIEVIRICNFFLQRYNALTMATLSLQIKKMKREMKKEKETARKMAMMEAIGVTQTYLNSLKNGDGFTLSKLLQN